MTCREKLKIEHPEYVSDDYVCGVNGCPIDYGYLEDPDYCREGGPCSNCRRCWDREIPGTEHEDERDEQIAKLTRMLESKNGLIGTLKETTQKAKDEVAAKEDYCREMEIDLLDKIRKLSEARRENRVLMSINEILYKRLKDLGEDI